MKYDILDKVEQTIPDKEKILYCYKMMNSIKDLGIVNPSDFLSYFKYVIKTKNGSNLDNITLSRLCYLVKVLYKIDAYKILNKELIEK